MGLSSEARQRGLLKSVILSKRRLDSFAQKIKKYISQPVILSLSKDQPPADSHRLR
jgi:hypothetical protein